MLTIEIKDVNSGVEFFHYLKKFGSGAKSAENLFADSSKIEANSSMEIGKRIKTQNISPDCYDSWVHKHSLM
jgi:hypothetical protein